eukprot:5602145-Pyramimonas_sp.AAC.1
MLIKRPRWWSRLTSPPSRRTSSRPGHVITTCLQDCGRRSWPRAPPSRALKMLMVAMLAATQAA